MPAGVVLVGVEAAAAACLLASGNAQLAQLAQLPQLDPMALRNASIPDMSGMVRQNGDELCSLQGYEPGSTSPSHKRRAVSYRDVSAPIPAVPYLGGPLVAGTPIIVGGLDPSSAGSAWVVSPATFDPNGRPQDKAMMTVSASLAPGPGET